MPGASFDMPGASFDIALFVAAVWVGLVSLVAGLLLVRRRKARGPPHPFTSALVSGLLIGISFLVVLPEALERLPAAGWTVSQVMVLFLAAAATMFFLDHSLIQHQHVSQGEQLPTMLVESAAQLSNATADAELDPYVWTAKAGEVPVWVSSSTLGQVGELDPAVSPAAALSTAEMMSRDEKADMDPKQPFSTNSSDKPAPQTHAPVSWCPCHGGDPFAEGGFTISFNPLEKQFKTKNCPKVVKRCPKVTSGAPSPPPSPPSGFALRGLEEGYSLSPKAELLAQADPGMLESTPFGQGETGCQRACTVLVRVSAWMLHAMIDGMVLASAPSTYVLIATVPAITVCALQDVAAFTVTMARLGFDSPRSLTAAVVVISSAFPLGALASHAVLENASSEAAVNIVRTVVAGVFTYMALFELAPPHTHNRAANACYLLCFTCGVSTTYLIDLVEQFMAV